MNSYRVAIEDEIEMGTIVAANELAAAEAAHQQYRRENKEMTCQFTYTDRGASYMLGNGSRKGHGNGIPASNDTVFVYDLEGTLLTIVTYTADEEE